MANLITHSDLEALTRTTLSSADGTAVDALITGVEAFIKAEILDWTKAETATAHDFSGRGDSRLYLNRWANTITSVTIDGQALDADEYVNRGYCLDRLDGGTWTEGTDNITVTATWGFDAATGPADFVLGVKLIARQALNDYFQPETASEGVPGMSFSYVQGIYNQNALVAALLTRYPGPAIG